MSTLNEKEITIEKASNIIEDLKTDVNITEQPNLIVWISNQAA